MNAPLCARRVSGLLAVLILLASSSVSHGRGYAEGPYVDNDAPALCSAEQGELSWAGQRCDEHPNCSVLVSALCAEGATWKYCSDANISALLSVGNSTKDACTKLAITTTTSTLTVTSSTSTTATTTSTTQTITTSTATRVTRTSTSRTTVTRTATFFFDAEDLIVTGSEDEVYFFEAVQSDTTLRGEVAGRAAAQVLNQTNTPQIYTDIGNATLTATFVSFMDLPNGSNVSLAVPRSAINVTIPYSLLEAIGADVVLTIVVHEKNRSTAWDMPITGATFAEAPVDISILWANSSEKVVFAEDFEEPILLELLEDATTSFDAGARCAFWDEDTKLWSGRGLQAMESVSGKFTCATYHLSIFAAILGDFIEHVHCKQFPPLSLEGVSQMIVGNWWYRVPAIFTAVLILGHVTLLVASRRRDLQMKADGLWDMSMLLTENESLHEGPPSPPSCFRSCRHAFCGCCSRQGQKRDGSMRMWLLEIAALTVAERQLSVAVGNINPKDLVALSLVGIVPAECLAKRIDVYRTRSLCQLTWDFFVDRHPFTYARTLRIRSSCFLQTSMLTAAMLGGLCINAVFFATSPSVHPYGSILSVHDHPKCVLDGSFWAMMGRSAVVGLLSVMVAAIPLVFISRTRSHGFKYMGEFDKDLALKVWLQCWRHEDLLQLVILAVYAVCALLYILYFLANVKEESDAFWIAASAASVLAEVLIFPGLQALSLAMLSSYVAKAWPALPDKLTERLHRDLSILRAMPPGSPESPRSTMSQHEPAAADGMEEFSLQINTSTVSPKSPLPGQIEDEEHEGIEDAQEGSPNKEEQAEDPEAEFLMPDMDPPRIHYLNEFVPLRALSDKVEQHEVSVREPLPMCGTCGSSVAFVSKTDYCPVCGQYLIGAPPMPGQQLACEKQQSPKSYASEVPGSPASRGSSSSRGSPTARGTPKFRQTARGTIKLE